MKLLIILAIVVLFLAALVIWICINVKDTKIEPDKDEDDNIIPGKKNYEEVTLIPISKGLPHNSCEDTTFIIGGLFCKTCHHFRGVEKTVDTEFVKCANKLNFK